MRKVGLAALLLCAAGPAFAVSAVSSAIVSVEHLDGSVYGFTQHGFGPNGVVIGSFTGSDLDRDGQISSRDGEITAFALGFAGAHDVMPLAFGLDDLVALVYDLDSTIGNGLTGDIEGISAFASNGAFYLSGPHAFRPCGDGNVCAVIEDAQIALLPAPAPLALLIPAAALVALARRARR